jgi:hypothetical protein
MDQSEIAIEFLKLGADDFILKANLDRESLLNTIALALEKKEIELERDLFFSVSLNIICTAGPDGYKKNESGVPADLGVCSQ